MGALNDTRRLRVCDPRGVRPVVPSRGRGGGLGGEGGRGWGDVCVCARSTAATGAAAALLQRVLKQQTCLMLSLATQQAIQQSTHNSG